MANIEELADRLALDLDAAQREIERLQRDFARDGNELGRLHMENARLRADAEWHAGNTELNQKLLRENGELRAALAAADVLAHNYVYTPQHRRYWELRGGEGECTVCSPVETTVATSMDHGGGPFDRDGNPGPNARKHLVS